MDVQASDNFRSNLRSAITARGLTQRDFADEAKITLAYLNRILTGKQCPTLSMSDKLARAVKLPLPLLVSDPEEFSKKSRRLAQIA